MKKFLPVLVALLAAFALAFCVACSSGSASSSAESSAASSEASAEASASADVAADSANLEDGTYTIEVTLEGGSGKAFVESPMQLNVIDSSISAVVVWSSPNYDQMIVDGEQYLPVPRAGNSTFEIPLSELADELPIQAETTAMSEPHMIDYIIHFDLATLQKA